LQLWGKFEVKRWVFHGQPEKLAKIEMADRVGIGFSSPNQFPEFQPE
jgi:hypothetical protein